MPAVVDPSQDLRAARDALSAAADDATISGESAETIRRAIRALDAITTAHSALDAARNQPTISVEQYGEILGLHRITAYEHAKRGVFPTIRVGRRVRVPSAFVLRQLGLDAEVR